MSCHATTDSGPVFTGSKRVIAVGGPDDCSLPPEEGAPLLEGARGAGGWEDGDEVLDGGKHMHEEEAEGWAGLPLAQVAVCSAVKFVDSALDYGGGRCGAG